MIKTILRKLIYCIPYSEIIMLHHVTDSPEIKLSNCVLNEKRFEEFLDRYDVFSSLEQVVNKPSGREIAITFDDGLEDVYRIAYPALKKRGIPMTICVSSELVGEKGYITETQLQEMAKDSLVTVLSHGATHVKLTDIDRIGVENEVCNSKKKIEAIIHKDIKGYVYSHGQFDRTSISLVRKTYKYALGTQGYPLNALTVLFRYRLPRLNLTDSNYDMVLNKIDGMFVKKG